MFLILYDESLDLSNSAHAIIINTTTIGIRAGVLESHQELILDGYFDLVIHFWYTSRGSTVKTIPRALLILGGFYNHFLIIKRGRMMGIRSFSGLSNIHLRI